MQKNQQNSTCNANYETDLSYWRRVASVINIYVPIKIAAATSKNDNEYLTIGEAIYILKQIESRVAIDYGYQS